MGTGTDTAVELDRDPQAECSWPTTTRQFKPYRIRAIHDDGAERDRSSIDAKFDRNLALSELTCMRYRLSQAGWIEGEHYFVERRYEGRWERLVPATQ